MIIARCGCSSQCSCSVTAGPNITVTGTGTAINPYVVSGTAASIVQADTPTVDLSGNGTVGTPLTAAVKISAVAGNILTAQADGLAVLCEDVQDCIGSALGPGMVYNDGANTISVRLSTDPGNTAIFGGDSGVFVPAGAAVVADTPCIDLAGSGTVGSPLTATPILQPGATNLLACTPTGLAVLCESVQDCVGAAFGDGLTYDDAANSYTAHISTTPGNSISISGDGGLFVPPGGAATITTADTPCIDLSGNGAGATPLTATPILQPGATNLLTCTPTGLAVLCEAVQDCVGAAFGQGLFYDDAANIMRARLSTDAGNTTIFGTDGGIYSPASAGVVGLCGLEGAGTLASPLVANVATWAFPCPQTAANATKIYCDPATGELQGEPPQGVAFDQQFINTTPAPTAVPAGAGAGTPVGPPLSLTVNNPSTCRSAFAILEIEVDADFDLPAGGTAELMIDADVMWRDQNRGATTQQDIHSQGTKVVSASVAVAPGGSLTVVNELRMRGGAGGATYDRTQLTGRMWLITI